MGMGEPGLILLQETKRKRASEVRRTGTIGEEERTFRVGFWAILCKY